MKACHVSTILTRGQLHQKRVLNGLGNAIAVCNALAITRLGMHEVGLEEEGTLCSKIFSQPHFTMAFLYLDLVNAQELWLLWNFCQTANGMFRMYPNKSGMEVGEKAALLLCLTHSLLERHP